MEIDLTKLAGQRVGSYVLQSFIGAGGFGAVYRAVSIVGGQEIGTPVAVKLIPATGQARADQRTLNELQLVVTLRHPHIVEAIGRPGDDVVTYASRHQVRVFWFAMELAEQSLAERLRRGPLPQAEVLALGRQIGAALQHLHGRDLVHRDVKPGNILRVGGVWKLSDLGLTRTEVEGYSSYQVLATERYIPPEALDGGLPKLPWDVWAFGLTLLEAATGHHPASGLSQRDWIRLLVSDGKLALPPLPAPLAGAVERCMAKAPADRATISRVLELVGRAEDRPRAREQARSTESSPRAPIRPNPPGSEKRGNDAELEGVGRVVAFIVALIGVSFPLAWPFWWKAFMEAGLVP